VKQLTDKPVAVITNGALLREPEVRAELLEADAVMPTVSAGTERTYLRLHRPAHGLSFHSFVEGLVAFREIYRGELWAEVMLVRGFNDDATELAALAEVLRRVRPDAIQIVLPTRPPALPAIHPAGPEQVALAIRVLSAVAKVSAAAEAPDVSVAGGDLQEVLLGLVQRHPMTEAELARALDRWTPDEVSGALEALTESKRLLSIERCGRRFFSSAEARYVQGADRA
jgi:wyosine [tRNA(Phe)-imidazoG37] synthetase (radical SAM superfamily)